MAVSPVLSDEQRRALDRLSRLPFMAGSYLAALWRALVEGRAMASQSGTPGACARQRGRASAALSSGWRCRPDP
jgi:hypothetical protein